MCRSCRRSCGGACQRSSLVFVRFFREIAVFSCATWRLVSVGSCEHLANCHVRDGSGSDGRNSVKRQLIHVGAFNLSLIFRQTLGAGTPRELRNRQLRLIYVAFWFRIALETKSARSTCFSQLSQRQRREVQHPYVPNCRRTVLGGSATGS